MITKEILEILVSEGKTIREISTEVNLSFTGIRYWLKKYKLKTIGNYKPIKWNEEVLKTNVEKSTTKADVLRKMGLLLRPGNYRTFDRYVKLYGIDTSHFNSKLHKNRFNNRKYTNEEIFSENSLYQNNTSLKKRLIDEGFKQEICEVCKNTGEWNGKKLKLQLDHVNGKNNDNRIENLRFLCPNCHSQTSTFCKK